MLSSFSLPPLIDMLPFLHMLVHMLVCLHISQATFPSIANFDFRGDDVDADANADVRTDVLDEDAAQALANAKVSNSFFSELCPTEKVTMQVWRRLVLNIVHRERGRERIL